MHIIGVAGHPRRIADSTQYANLTHLVPLNKFMTHSAILLGLFQVLFVYNFFKSMFVGEKAGRNPWHSNTLEWECPSPPGHGNFEALPTVYRGPYEYASPEVAEDYLPQAKKLPSDQDPLKPGHAEPGHGEHHA
jgi:cytochrome c oxidase subunit 1